MLRRILIGICLGLTSFMLTVPEAVSNVANHAYRNHFYDDLFSRGRRIEEELGIDTGQFRGRLNPSNWLIQHDVVTNLIYGTALDE
jgi:hypothetical protein